MPTQKKRINLTVEDDFLESLEFLKEKRQMPSLSAVIMDLARQALDLQEDIYLANIAQERSNEEEIDHDKVWK